MREITCYVQGHNRNTTRLGVTLHSCMRCISSIKWYVLYLQLTLLVSLQTEELWEPLTTWPNQINRWYWFTVRTMCSITFISIWCHLRQGRDPNRLVLSLSLTRLFSIFYSLPPSLPPFRNVPEQPAQSAWPQVTDGPSIQVYQTMCTTHHLNFRCSFVLICQVRSLDL